MTVFLSHLIPWCWRLTDRPVQCLSITMSCRCWRGGLTPRSSVLLLYLGLPVPGPANGGTVWDRRAEEGQEEGQTKADCGTPRCQTRKSHGALFVTHGTNNANAPPPDTRSHRREIERERQPGCHKLHNLAVSWQQLGRVERKQEKLSWAENIRRSQNVIFIYTKQDAYSATPEAVITVIISIFINNSHERGLADSFWRTITSKQKWKSAAGVTRSSEVIQQTWSTRFIKPVMSVITFQVDVQKAEQTNLCFRTFVL